MHDNTISQISDPGPGNALGLAMQVAFVGTVFVFAISGMATIVFSLVSVI